MEKILIFIKHHLSFLWVIIEWVNDILFSFLYNVKLQKSIEKTLNLVKGEELTYGKLKAEDIQKLYELIKSQNPDDLRYFNPHGFEMDSLQKQFKKKSFLMMGGWDQDKLIGYFFLRFFANKKSFVGRLIDKEYRGVGIGPVMNKIMYNISWNMKFRCLSTISKNNKAVVGAHKKNSAMVVLKELRDNYLLIEFVDK